MSQTVSSLVAPPPVPSPWLNARRDVPRNATVAGGSVPFSRTSAPGPFAWIAGLAFGLACIGAGLVFVVALAVVGVALAAAGVVAACLARLR
jgi:hypothetical protein